MSLCTARLRRAEPRGEGSNPPTGIRHGAAVPHNGESPRVVFIEWIEPLMAGGNWMPTLIEMAGGVNLLGKAGEHSPWITWDQLAAADPDVIVVAPCGFKIADSQRDMHYLTSNPAWNNLRAVCSGNVHVEDGNQFFNRPGPRLAESFEILAEIFDQWRG